MIAASRDMQTELLRYIANIAEMFSVRMRHVEANASNPDTAERLRLVAIEDRLLRIERRVLGKTPDAPKTGLFGLSGFQATTPFEIQN